MSVEDAVSTAVLGPVPGLIPEARDAVIDTAPFVFGGLGTGLAINAVGDFVSGVGGLAGIVRDAPTEPVNGVGGWEEINAITPGDLEAFYNSDLGRPYRATGLGDAKWKHDSRVFTAKGEDVTVAHKFYGDYIGERNRVRSEHAAYVKLAREQSGRNSTILSEGPGQDKPILGSNPEDVRRTVLA